MATKSMLKDISIKDNKLGSEFAQALEAATERSKAEPITDRTAKRECIELAGDKIKEFFGVRKE